MRLGEEKKKKIDRKKLQGKNIMAPLLHRVAIISTYTVLYTTQVVTGIVIVCSKIPVLVVLYLWSNMALQIANICIVKYTLQCT